MKRLRMKDFASLQMNQTGKVLIT